MTNLHNEIDYTAWLTELKGLLIGQYAIEEKIASDYATASNWEDYFNEDYSPSEAIEEDSQYWSAE